MKLTKLNLGCGYAQHIAWVNVDKLDYGQEIVADILEGLPFEDDRFDFVLMNHTLQMFKYDELPIVLKEVRRVMKPGATLRILTPDIMAAIHDLTAPDALTEDFEVPITRELEPTQTGRLIRWIFWHGDTRCGFSQDSLKDLLERHNFTNVKLGKFGECELDSREEESLIMTCEK